LGALEHVDGIVNRYINFKETDENIYLIRDGKKIEYKEAEKEIANDRKSKS
jgi:hypothetical protein